MTELGAVESYEVSIAGAPSDWAQTIMAFSRGQAKSSYLAHVRDAYPDMPYTLVRARKVAGPKSSADFIRCATYRGLPHVRCGDPVTVDGDHGTVVGHNGSANFEILFSTGKYAGQTVPVHPAGCVWPRG